MKKLVGVFILATFLLTVPGCAVFQGGDPLAVDVLTRAAVARLLTEKPEYAEDTARISWGVLVVVGDYETVSLQEIETYVIDQIGWDNLQPEEVDLIIFLITSIRDYIEERISAGEDGKVVVRRFFRAIYETSKTRN